MEPVAKSAVQDCTDRFPAQFRSLTRDEDTVVAKALHQRARDFRALRFRHGILVPNNQTPPNCQRVPTTAWTLYFGGNNEAHQGRRVGAHLLKQLLP